MTTVCVIGELMVEIPAGDKIPQWYSTEFVKDFTPPRIGGPAFNTTRNLVSLKEDPKLVSALGSDNRQLFRASLSGTQINEESVCDFKGTCDILVSIKSSVQYAGIYLLADLEPLLKLKSVESACAGADFVIITGSRHECLRAVYCDLVTNGAERVFAPNYALIEYSRKELTKVIQSSEIVAVNESEADHIRKALELPAIHSIVSSRPHTLIVTRGARGAHIYQEGTWFELPRKSSSDEDEFGAGDAFLSAFLFELAYKGRSVIEAGRFASEAAGWFVDMKRSLGNPYPLLDEEEIRKRMS